MERAPLFCLIGNCYNEIKLLSFRYCFLTSLIKQRVCSSFFRSFKNLELRMVLNSEWKVAEGDIFPFFFFFFF